MGSCNTTDSTRDDYVRVGYCRNGEFGKVSNHRYATFRIGHSVFPDLPNSKRQSLDLDDIRHLAGRARSLLSSSKKKLEDYFPESSTIAFNCFSKLNHE